MKGKIILLGFVCLLFVMCGNTKNPDDVELDKPVLVSSIPADGSENIQSGSQTIVLTFDQNIVMLSPYQININGTPTTAIAAFKELKIMIELEPATTYNIVVSSGSVRGPTGVGADEIRISFKTRDSAEEDIKTSLVTINPTPEAQRVYDFLLENYGTKIVSGAMANVAWNINEAEWVYKHTGKYPALNCFDYIHLYASPASWIDYTDTEVVETWWSNNGLVAAMWHWNVPAAPGSTDYAFYTNGTSFDVSKAVQDGTYENGIVKADLEDIANHLMMLQEKNIPVIWRPLHEAAGGWFWWGAKGAEPCKALWKMMFETFEEKGLKNLIWVWTSETNDQDWYPGDEYVDIIGRDSYNRNAATLLSEFEWIRQTYPDKMVALSEFGSAAGISEQWNRGAKWLWFMPWYDYERTVNTSGEEFEKSNHQFADINYWEEALKQEQVITRDEMPDLKQK